VLFIVISAGAQSDRQVPDTIARTEITPHVKFDLDTVNHTNSGRIKLVWLVDEDILDQNLILFELQQSEDSNFTNAKTRYSGPDLASYISGLPNGSYYYRVRSVSSDGLVAGPWSETISVVVKHHSLKLALVLFGLGGVVFILTVILVLRGVRSVSEEAS